MRVTVTNKTSAQSQKILQALRDAVGQELDKKQRLGQAVVIWKDGRPIWVDAQVAAKESP